MNLGDKSLVLRPKLNRRLTLEIFYKNILIQKVLIDSISANELSIILPLQYVRIYFTDILGREVNLNGYVRLYSIETGFSYEVNVNNTNFIDIKYVIPGKYLLEVVLDSGFKITKVLDLKIGGVELFIELPIIRKYLRVLTNVPVSNLTIMVFMDDEFKVLVRNVSSVREVSLDLGYVVIPSKVNVTLLIYGIKYCSKTFYLSYENASKILYVPLNIKYLSLKFKDLLGFDVSNVIVKPMSDYDVAISVQGHEYKMYLPYNVSEMFLLVSGGLFGSQVVKVSVGEVIGEVTIRLITLTLKSMIILSLLSSILITLVILIWNSRKGEKKRRHELSYQYINGNILIE